LVDIVNIKLKKIVENEGEGFRFGEERKEEAKE